MIDNAKSIVTRILFNFNQETVEHPEKASITELFENIAAKIPNEIAVITENVEITYSELNKKANQLAANLRYHGVKPDQFVAIAAERKIETIIGILGIIKAGGAYMPLDPKYPLNRIAYMIEDSNCSILLTGENRLKAILEEKVKVIDLRKKYNFIGAGENLSRVNIAKDLAYLIYTSGTTGMPKGVMIEHRNVNRLVRNTNYINFTNIRILQTGSMTFDAATFEIWGALLNGGSVYIAKEDVLSNVASLKHVIKHHKINSMFITTALFNQLISIDQTVFDSLDQLLFGGEATSEEHVRKLRDHNDKIYLSNVYGPTETTTFALYYPIGTSGDGLRAKTPIGKPITNTTAYILDGLNMCDIGVSGELCIGGEGVARGYLNREELTTAKFIENPYKKGELIYRTGDIAKWLEDGNIEYMGRLDDQVKLRGFRIELGEIEHRLRELAEIDDAKVIMDENNGDKYLGAYIIENITIEISEIKNKLKEVLPDYMIPAQIMKMETFPINKNGKVDKNALPKFKIISDKEYEAPRNDKEADILKVFKEILGVEQIGIRDSFFELGGDSIKAIRMVSKIRGLGYEVSVSEVMQQKTIAALAVKAQSIDTLTIEQGEVSGRVLLTPIQVQFFESNLANPHHLNQSVMFESDQKIAIASLKKSLTALTHHHDMLRTLYPDDGQIIQPISDKLWYAFDYCDYSYMDNLPEAIALLEERGDNLQAALNLVEGPLIRVGLFRTRKKDYLLMCVHHLIVDGISWRILAEDLNLGYRLAQENREIVFPEKTVSFQKWSMLLAEYRESHLLKSEIPYWLNTQNIISDSKLALVADKYENGIIEEKIVLSEEDTNKLLYQAMKIPNLEINDLLLTAVFRALQKLTGTENLSIYMEGHGRECIHKAAPIDRTVGWFTTIFPLAVLGIGKSLIDDIRCTKEAFRRIPNHGLGYTVLKALGEKVLKNVEPDITFNYLGNFSQENDSHTIKIKDTDHGKQVSSKNRFGTPIVFDGVVIHKEFQMIVAYDTAVCSSSFIKELIQEFKQQLIDIIAFCTKNNIEDKLFATPSDKGELEWSIDEYLHAKTSLSEEGLEIDRIYPMTALQEGMLYHKLSAPSSTCYIVQSGFKVDGVLDEKALQESFELLASKHEVLRTCMLHKQVSIPRQVLLANRKIEANFIDLTGAHNRNAKYEQLKRNDVSRGFDFEKDSLFRVSVVRMADCEYRILMCFHHIIVDGWCLSIINNDLRDFYNRLLAGESKPAIAKSLPKSASYEDYIRLTRKRNITEGLGYWKALLEGYETQVTIIGSQKSVSDTMSELDEVKSLNISLSKENHALLVGISKKYGITMNTILEAVWAILLQKYNYTEDVVFGKVVSGRNIAFDDIDNKVGLFINTVPVRLKSNGNESVLRSLEQLQNQALSTEKYDYCPLPDIQNQSTLGNQLIDTLLAFGNYYTQEEAANGKLALILDSFREQTNYALTLAAYEEDGLRLELMYDTAKYTLSEVQNIMNSFHLILAAIMNDVHIKIKDISLISKREEARILKEFNQTASDYAENKTVAELFEEAVAKTPNATAVVAGDSELTYLELNEKANQLAEFLRRQGIKADCFVGIIAERKIETIVGILGILKAGGAYMPIDPKYPLNRIEYMVNDSNCRILLTGKTIAENSKKLQKISNQVELIIDLEDERSYSNKTENLEKVNTSRDLAYLIYTSGTTGEPKGVMIENRSVNRLVMNSNYLDFNEARILQTGSLTFDASTFEIWGALLHGGQLFIVDSDVLASASRLKETLSKNKINTMWLTASLFNQMINFDRDVFGELKYLLIGGERLSEKHVRILKENNRNLHLINGYGPTETTTFATTYEIKDTPKGSIPIGKPIANTEIYIVNGNHLCAVGMKGEVCIGGPGLARGYLNQKELTKEKFVNNPFDPSKKMYRTGDLGCWLDDGNIEYLGRIDNQVKLRGFRIEIGEIENKIKELPTVEDAVVLLLEANGEKYLAGYIVTGSEFKTEAIKKELSAYLPDYMIPTYLIKIDNIPTTINGKLDQRRLPKPQADVTKGYAAPGSEIERCIAESFTEILGVKQVGRNDNFFELGGHSLRAVRLVNMIEKKLGVDLPLREIMTGKTVKALADKVEHLNRSEKYQPIMKQPKGERYEMSFAQKRMYIIHEMDPNSITYNIPMIFKVEGLLDSKQMKDVCNKLCKRHELLRTRFEEKNDRYLQLIQDHLDFNIEYEETEPAQIGEIINNFIRPFDLSKAPLMRVKIVKQSKETSILMIDIHHIIFDGGSNHAFFEDMAKLYNHEILPELEIQYKDYSVWHNNKCFEKDEAYWLNEFSGEIPVLELPTDYPREKYQSYQGCTLRSMLTKNQKTRIKQFAVNTGTTEYMVLFSVFNLLLNKYTLQNELIIGTPMADRVHPDTQDMLGMFVNTLAMKTVIDPDLKYHDFLEIVKEKCLKAYEHQDYPLDRLLDNIDITRDTSRNPLFNVLFVLQNNEEHAQALGQAKMSPLPFDYTASKFDITLLIDESEENYVLNWEYCTDLFKQETIKQLSRHFVILLEDILNYPDKSLKDIDMLDLEDIRTITEFNQTTTNFPKDKTIAELFEEVADKNPDAIAVITSHEEMTYSELNKKSNQLARNLRHQGVMADSIVGIIAERKIETIIGILGIIKAGGAYLPIDPKHPLSRIDYMLKDADCKILLTGKTDKENYVKIQMLKAHVNLVINLEEEAGYSQESENLEKVNTAGALAYLIYTSGTTGEPKGVMIEHRNVNRLVKDTDYVNFEGAKILQTGALTFDASTFEIWGALLNGGQLYLVDADVLTSASKLKDTLSMSKTNMMWLTSSLFNQMVTLDKGMFDSLTYLLIGGERLSKKHVGILKEYNKKIRLINGYGPTETTTFATTYEIKDIADKNIPIGRPIANTKIYILNNKKLCGVGIKGEICIGGAGVARGYLNHKELTAEKFIENPYNQTERLYRTGDLGRWLSDGTIEFIGRIDNQVKLRGFRIEIGEIESKIKELPYIEDAAVIMLESKGEKYLAGYLVGRTEISMEEAKRTLAESLPDYMIPTYLMQIDKLPTTLNGKLDKNKLPTPQIASGKDYIAPENATEKQIAACFSQILGIPQISADANFFELGGHSLKAAKLVNLIENIFTVYIPLHTVFRNNTVKKLAKLVAEAKTADGLQPTLAVAEEVII